MIASAASSIQAGRNAKAVGEASGRQADHNAEVARHRAQAQNMKGRYEQKRHQKSAASILSAQKARMGARGGDVQSGANLAASREQGKELELEGLLMGWESRQAEAQYLRQASNAEIEGQLLRESGRSEAAGEYMKAGETLLTGLNKGGAFKKKKPPLPTSAGAHGPTGGPYG